MVKISSGDQESDNISLVDSLLDRFGLSKLRQGRERSFNEALYNSIIFILIILCTVAVVLTILQPFIKPLIWALLCGSVLHPFKYTLSSSFKRWLRYLEGSSKPLSVEIASVPAFVLLNLSEFVGNIVISKSSAVCFGLFITAYLLTNIYNYTPVICFTVFWKLFTVTEFLMNTVMNIFQNSVVVVMTVTLFLSMITLLWDSQKTHMFVVASYVTWISVTCHVVSYFDYLRLPLFILLLTTCAIGVLCKSWLENACASKADSSAAKKLSFKSTSNQEDGGEQCSSGTILEGSVEDLQEITPIKFDIGAKVNTLDKSKYTYHVSDPEKKDNEMSSSGDALTKDFAILSSKQSVDITWTAFKTRFIEAALSPEESTNNGRLSDLRELLKNPHTSDIYIYTMCIGCGVIVIVKNLWLLYSIAFLFVIHLTKLFCIGFGIWLFVQDFWDSFTSQLEAWYTSRSEILIPTPVAAFFKISGIMKKYILCYVKDYCDAVASITVILAVLSTTVLVSSFLCLQIYTEGFYMVKVSGQIINQTVVHNPELTQLLPKGWESQLDSVLNSAYTYGRELLSNTLHRMLKDIPEAKSNELEQTALELWDRVYQAWVMTSLEQSIGPKVTSTAVFQTWSQFVDGVQKTPGLMNLNNLNSLVVDNMATLSAGLESVWVLVKGNASLLLQAITTLLSVVVSHGAALLGFVINMIIFLTALFYLLSSSRALYKPVEILTHMLPQHGNNLAVAMETASKEVIVASFKLLVFYGLWTWFIHNIFLMNITYLPSVFAAILAVVPVLGTYWACLPGVIDLWLAQGKGIHALSLAICQFLPTTIVDTTIYNEIHGGHPYLTGLAVAGGVLCLGIEGAIIGPLALCGLLVIINLCTGFLRESTQS